MNHFNDSYILFDANSGGDAENKYDKPSGNSGGGTQTNRNSNL